MSKLTPETLRNVGVPGYSGLAEKTRIEIESHADAWEIDIARMHKLEKALETAYLDGFNAGRTATLREGNNENI
jgi:hypothetical protein